MKKRFHPAVVVRDPLHDITLPLGVYYSTTPRIFIHSARGNNVIISVQMTVVNPMATQDEETSVTAEFGTEAIHPNLFR